MRMEDAKPTVLGDLQHVKRRLGEWEGLLGQGIFETHQATEYLLGLSALQ